MSEQYVCWKCGKSIQHLPLPLGRNAECSDCGADLHVCRSCVFFNESVSNQCSEPVADYVQEKQRANFCGYFQIKAHSYQVPENKDADKAKKELESLFGVQINTHQEEQDPDLAKKELERLFGIDKEKK